MGDKTGIEWTDATWNPTRGCRRISPGCINCYAERDAHRFSGPGLSYEGLTTDGRWNGKTRFVEDALDLPLRWREPRLVFVDSMSDLFYEGFTNEQIAAVFGIMAACRRHTFQVLTKRAGRAAEWFAWARRHGDGFGLMRTIGSSELLTCAWEACCGVAWADHEPHRSLGETPSPEVFGDTWPLPNVWLGASVENQAAADERISLLYETPAAVRFLSCEPLIGPVDLTEYLLDPLMPLVDWVIAGGESGPGARPMRADWARGLRDQCAQAGVPFFFKQWGEHDEAGARVGKKASGALLDGVEHKAFPRCA